VSRHRATHVLEVVQHIWLAGRYRCYACGARWFRRRDGAMIAVDTPYRMRFHCRTPYRMRFHCRSCTLAQRGLGNTENV